LTINSLQGSRARCSARFRSPQSIWTRRPLLIADVASI
jgi:hypothetical protein